MTRSNLKLAPMASPTTVSPPEDGGSGTVVSIEGARTPVAPTVIAVTSGKGGVGKTNVSVNLGIGFASLGARVLCIDADLGLANMDIIMGVAPTYTARDLVRGEVEVEDTLVEGPEGVWLLPGASGQADLANLGDAERMSLFAAVDKLDDRFDVVIVDTGAGVGTNSTSFASAARDIVIVITPEPTSVADAYGMIKVLRTHCGVRRMKVVANMVASSAEGERVFTRIQGLTDRFLDVNLDYLGAVPKDPTVARSVMRGQPFASTYPDCPASLGILEVARKLNETSDSDDRQGAIRLFWRKLLREGGNRS